MESTTSLKDFNSTKRNATDMQHTTAMTGDSPSGGREIGMFYVLTL